jgi:uncharacterized MnhB-related membrane protein
MIGQQNVRTFCRSSRGSGVVAAVFGALDAAHNAIAEAALG